MKVLPLLQVVSASPISQVKHQLHPVYVVPKWRRLCDNRLSYVTSAAKQVVVMARGVANLASPAPDNQACTAEHRQSVVQWLVCAEMVAKHGVPAHFRLFGVQDLCCQFEKSRLATCLIIVEQFIG